MLHIDDTFSARSYAVQSVDVVNLRGCQCGLKFNKFGCLCGFTTIYQDAKLTFRYATAFRNVSHKNRHSYAVLQIH